MRELEGLEPTGSGRLDKIDDMPHRRRIYTLYMPTCRSEMDNRGASSCIPTDFVRKVLPLQAPGL